MHRMFRTPRTTLAAALALTFLAPVARARQGTPAAAVAPTATATPTPAPPTPSDIARGAGKKLDAYLAAEARAALEPLVPLAATNVDVAIALGRLLEQEKKYDESAAVLRRAAGTAPADARVALWLGETLLRAKKPADADASFKVSAELAAAAVVATPDDAGALLVQGSALSRLRRYDEAMVALGKARDLDGGSPETLYQMGATRAFQQKWTDAVTFLDQSLEKDSGTALAYYYRALAQEKLGRKDLMVIDLDRFVKVAPSAPEADRARALLAAARR